MVSTVNQRRTLLVKKLGRVEYGAALELQKQNELAVKAGQQADTLLLLEHPHTLTVGRRGDRNGIFISQELLAARGVTVFETNRGGKITYHGLGQVVGYPIINLSPDREDVHRYVRDLEEVLIRTLADFNIDGFRLEGFTGVIETATRSKASVRSSIKTVREGLDKLEIDFRTTPELQRYYIPLVGVAGGAATAEDLAANNQFDKAGRSLLNVVNQLTDVLLLMR